MGKVAKLIMITTDNNNKFYEMSENDNGTFTAKWGRVGASGQSKDYPMSKWNSTYNSKTKKGYKDNTELFLVEESVEVKSGAVKKVKDFISTRTSAVISIVKKLQGWANKSVEENYTVSSENVTQKQVDRAQEVLNEIVAFDLTVSNRGEFNNKLIEFYGIVPRKMKNVNNHLVAATDDLTKRKNEIIGEEQDTLDVMAGQVKLNTPDLDVDKDGIEDVETDIIKSSGLDIIEVKDSKVIENIKKLMGPNAHQFKEAFEVVNTKTQSMFTNHTSNVKNNKTELFWHGSRNENWWSIMTSGLLIRPSNAVHTGSMFGDSIYFADRFQKSYGYTSGRNSYWTKGNSKEAILALYNVHVGEQKHIYKHDSSCYRLNYKILEKDGYDSVFAHGGIDLRNNEYMIYQSQQCTIKYLVIVNA